MKIGTYMALFDQKVQFSQNLEELDEALRSTFSIGFMTFRGGTSST